MDGEWGNGKVRVEFLEGTPVAVGVVEKKVDVGVVRCRGEDLALALCVSKKLRRMPYLKEVIIDLRKRGSPPRGDAKRDISHPARDPSSLLCTRNPHRAALHHIISAILDITPPSHGERPWRPTLPDPNTLIPTTARQQSTITRKPHAFTLRIMSLERRRAFPLLPLHSSPSLSSLSHPILLRPMNPSGAVIIVLRHFFPYADSRIETRSSQRPSARCPGYTPDSPFMGSLNRARQAERGFRTIGSRECGG